MKRTLAGYDKHPPSARNLPLTKPPLAFAPKRHPGHRPEPADAPSAFHPIEVASLLREAGYPDHVIAAGTLHDVIENTDTQSGDLVKRFGPKVALLVTAVSEDPSIEDDGERKAELRSQVARAGDEAVAI